MILWRESIHSAILRGIPTQQGLKHDPCYLVFAGLRYSQRYSNTTRIETYPRFLDRGYTPQILRGIPTQQGLKPRACVILYSSGENSQRYSNTTRIETDMYAALRQGAYYSQRYSNTTRIETSKLISVGIPVFA